MWGANLAWDSSAPLGTSAHQPPFHWELQGLPHSCAPSPLLPACSSAWWGSAPSSCSTPKRDLPIHRWLFANPSAHSPGFHCPVLLCGGVLPHPFLSVPPQSLQCECPVGVSWVTTRLGGAAHTARGVRVLPWLGAIRISTSRATPALFRRGVNQFCTGTSSCHWDLADWSNPCVHGGESIPSDPVLLPLN